MRDEGVGQVVVGIGVEVKKKCVKGYKELVKLIFSTFTKKNKKILFFKILFL